MQTITNRLRMSDDKELIVGVGAARNSLNVACARANSPVDPFSRAQTKRVSPKASQLDTASRKKIDPRWPIHPFQPNPIWCYGR